MAQNEGAIQRPEPDDGAVLVIEAFTLHMALWKLQAFFTSETLNLFAVDAAAVNSQQLSNLALAISAILLYQMDRGEVQFFLIVLPGGPLLQVRTAEDNHTASPTF